MVWAGLIILAAATLIGILVAPYIGHDGGWE